MLVTRRGAVLKLITHPEHGRLAGQLAAHWGNQRFAGPSPIVNAALLSAAFHHDDGWAELDGQPVHNEPAQRPAHFLELVSEQAVDSYRRGVDVAGQVARLRLRFTNLHRRVSALANLTSTASGSLVSCFHVTLIT